MEQITTLSIVAGLVTALIGFLIGKSGVLTRIFDTRIRRIETNQKKESDMIDDALAENKELRHEVLELRTKVTELESEIKEYKNKMDLIIEYLNKLDIKDTFIDKLTRTA